MIKYLKLNLFILLSINSLLSANAESLQVSVIIPCHFKHVIHLENLLKHYESQTVLPDEVVISISEVEKAPESLIDSLMNKNWAFPVKYILSKEKVYAGGNRNKACQIATGDIFVCQDADDLPYSNRIEVIKFFFNTHKIDHLMHLYRYSHNSEKPQVKVDDINFIYLKRFDDIWEAGEDIHNGNVAIRKNVFEKIQWTNKPRGQDVEFNRKVCEKFNCIVILEPLIIYRIEHSLLDKTKLYEQIVKFKNS